MENFELSDVCPKIINNWIDNYDKFGELMHNYTGGYWEVLYPVLKKYAPEKLEEYAKLIGQEFEIFNERVKELVDSGDEMTNYKNAIEYLNACFSYTNCNDVHYVADEENDEDIPYLPNQNIDIKQHLGRE